MNGIVAIPLPWAERARLKWTGVHVYESGQRYYSDSRDTYSVPFADKTQFVSQAWVDLVKSLGPLALADPPRIARSNYRPWVHDRRGYPVLADELDRCRVANVRADRVFDERDLVVHVRPYEGNRYDYRVHQQRDYVGISLVGIEIIGHPQGLVFQPIPRDWLAAS